jgi:hypothetical protein
MPTLLGRPSSHKRKGPAPKGESSPGLDPVHGARMMIALQIISRLVSFAVNNYIIRLVSADPEARDVYGPINFKFDLFNAFVNCVGKDALRTAIIKTSWIGAKQQPLAQQLVNAAWLMPLSVLFTGSLYCLTLDSSAHQKGLWLACLAAVIESCSEPAALVASLIQGQMRTRLIAETTALVAKSATILWYLKDSAFTTHQVLLALTTAQLLHSAVINLTYRALAGKWHLPTGLETGQRFLRLFWHLWWQASARYFLCPTERLIASWFCAPEHLSTFSMISNYGSLALRLVMQPVNDASFQFFAQTSRPEAALAFFQTNLKAVLCLASVFVSFGPFFTGPLVYALLGRKLWGEGVVEGALSFYCLHVALQLVSGFVDAFVQARLGHSDRNQLQYVSFATSALHVALAYAIVPRYGLFGLLAANLFGLALHIGCVFFFGLRRLRVSPHLPGLQVIQAATLCAAINVQLYYSFPEWWLMRIATGIGLGMGYLAVIHFSDRSFVLELRRIWL